MFAVLAEVVVHCCAPKFVTSDVYCHGVSTYAFLSQKFPCKIQVVQQILAYNSHFVIAANFCLIYVYSLCIVS